MNLVYYLILIMLIGLESLFAESCLLKNRNTCFNY